MGSLLSVTIVLTFLLKSPLLAIFLIVSVDVLGLTIILPLLPFYAEKLGATPAVVGLLVSTYALCQLVAGPILGRMSDHTGRRPLLLVSQIGTFIGFLILAYATRAVAGFFIASDRRFNRRQSLARASLHLRRHQAGRSGKIVRADRHRVRNGLSGRPRDLGISFAIQLSIPHLRCRRSFRHQHSRQPISCCRVGTAHTSDDATPRKFTVLDWGNYFRYFRSPVSRRCCGNSWPSRLRSRCS